VDSAAADQAAAVPGEAGNCSICEEAGDARNYSMNRRILIKVLVEYFVGKDFVKIKKTSGLNRPELFFTNHARAKCKINLDEKTL
jgi:hypothetical protein